MENQLLSKSFTLVSSTETEEEYEEFLPVVRRIHFCDFRRRNFELTLIGEFSLILSLDDERVANKSDGDIMEYVLVFEMFQRFSNTQTYVNKQTIS